MKKIKVILKSPLAIIRLVIVCLYTLIMYGLLLLVLLVHKQQPINLMWKMMNDWCKGSLLIMGVKVDLKVEEPMNGAGLILSNHRSYIDIFINLSIHQSRIIAKKEIGSWPVIGLAMRVFNVLMIDRSSISSRVKNLKQMEQILINGESLIIYPEGTTHRGPEIGPMKESTFKIASRNNIKVYPIAIEYENQDDAWIGKDLFGSHFIRRSGTLRRRVSVVIGKAIQTTDNELLRDRVKEFMRNETMRMRNEFDKKK